MPPLQARLMPDGGVHEIQSGEFAAGQPLEEAVSEGSPREDPRDYLARWMPLGHQLDRLPGRLLDCRY